MLLLWRGQKREDLLVRTERTVRTDREVANAESRANFALDAVEATKSAHCFLHDPNRHDCDACNRAKTTMARHVRSILSSDLKKLGELVTVDHIVCENCLKHKSVSGHKGDFSFFDFVTQEIWVSVLTH